MPASSIRPAAISSGLQNTVGVKASSIRPAAQLEALRARGLAPSSIRPAALYDATGTLAPSPQSEPEEVPPDAP